MRDYPTLAKYITQNDYWKFYDKTYRTRGKSKRLFMYISGKFNEALMDEILNGNRVTIPGNLGSVLIRGRKVSFETDKDGNIIKAPINWPETLKYWNRDPDAKLKETKVYHTNDHSNGYTYRFSWSHQGSIMSNKFVYSLRVSSEKKKELTRRIKEEKKEY